MPLGLNVYFNLYCKMNNQANNCIDFEEMLLDFEVGPCGSSEGVGSIPCGTVVLWAAIAAFVAR